MGLGSPPRGTPGRSEVARPPPSGRRRGPADEGPCDGLMAGMMGRGGIMMGGPRGLHERARGGGGVTTCYEGGGRRGRRPRASPGFLKFLGAFWARGVQRRHAAEPPAGMEAQSRRRTAVV